MPRRNERKGLGTAARSRRVLRLTPAHLDALWAHVRAEAPREACGVLGGVRAGADAEVRALHACRNAAAAPEWEFTVHPQDQLRAFLAIEEAGLDVVGFYHAHPRGPPGPSAIDAARASYPGCWYVVAWLAPEEALGAWVWEGGRFRRDGLESSPG